jgi:hypothetical protein
MPFSINILNNLNHSALLELNNTETAFYQDKIDSLPLFPSREEVLEIFSDIPISKSLDLVNLFKKVMLKKSGGKFTIKDFVKLYTLFPDYILWYEEKHNTFSEEYLNNLRTEVLNPKYLRKSNLSAPFLTTQGFDVQFKGEYKDNVIKYFPFFRDYIEEIVSDDISIYYLNALVLGIDSHVKHHYDQTLKKYSPETISYPDRVSVLYVDVPEMVGGNFILYKNEKHKVEKNRIFATIKPERNKLLYFKGNLSHEIIGISEVKSPETNLRISVVCEQYKLDTQTLKKIPNFYSVVPRANWFKLS